MWVSLATLALTVALSCHHGTHYVEAYPRFVAKLPNGANVAGVVALGHTDKANGGGELNVFGKAFANATFRWSTDLCQADSDGDGQTNGQELGDPCCSWVETTNLAYITGISDPSDPDSRVNPLFFESLECTKSEAAVEAADRAAKNTKKTQAKTRAPTRAPMANDGSGSSSSSGSGSSASRRKDANGPKIGSGSTHYEASLATALTVGIALLWAIL